jgi:hypothetical protein
MRYPFLQLMLTFVASHAVLTAAEPQVPEHAKALMGCWQNTTDASVYIRFQPHKVSWYSAGGLQMGNARYEPGKVMLLMNGKKHIWNVEIKEDVLYLAFNSRPSTYKKVNETPKELEMAPAPVAEAKPLAPEKLKELQDEIAKRQALAESTRKEPEHYGNVASDNGWWIKKTIKEVGWIDAARFGKDTSERAFLMVHASADLPLMLAALPGLETDAKTKAIDPQQYARMYDKVQLYIGERQLYGTQIGRDKGEMLMLPIVGTGKVEEARKALGLVSFKDYIETFEKHNGKKVKIDE